jgi:hypothetical protein
VNLLKNQGGHVNVRTTFTQSTESLAYMAFFGGIWMVIAGIRFGGFSGSVQPTLSAVPLYSNPNDVHIRAGNP